MRVPCAGAEVIVTVGAEEFARRLAVLVRRPGSSAYRLLPGQAVANVSRCPQTLGSPRCQSSLALRKSVEAVGFMPWRLHSHASTSLSLDSAALLGETLWKMPSIAIPLLPWL